MQNYNLPECATGNTFEGVEFTLPSSEIYNLTSAVVKIQVRSSVGAPVVREFKPADATLIIQLPYTIVLPKQIITLKPATYSWDLKIRFADGREKTYIGGRWIINPVITTL